MSKRRYQKHNDYYPIRGERSDKADRRVKYYDREVHQSLDKLFRKRYTSRGQIKEFLRGLKHDTTHQKFSIKWRIIEQEDVTIRTFLGVEFGKLSLLWIAVLVEYTESAELLVRFGADVDEPFGRHHPDQLIDEKWTVLQVLLQTNPCPENERLIRLIVDHGADLQARDSKGRSALHFAVMKYRVQLTEMLLENGVALQARDSERRTVLHLAVEGDQVQLAEMLLEKGADLRARNLRGESALHIAARNGRVQMAKMLLEKGADLQARDLRGKTALHLAASMGRVQVTEMLLEKGAEVNGTDDNGATPLLKAANSGKAAELLPLLMKHGADVSVRDKYGHNVFHNLQLVSDERHLAADLVRVLIEKGCSLDDRVHDSSQFQPIHQAALSGNNELLNIYLDHGANVNSLTDDGHSPLHLAVQRKSAGVLETLLKHSANVDLTTNKGRTALHEACARLNYESIKVLVSTGANVLVEDRDGKTPFALFSAIYNENMERLTSSRLIVKKLALEKIRQPSIELKDERNIERYPKLWVYYRYCIKQIERMKSTRFIETCTFFELLTKCHCKIAALMRNPEFETEFKRYDLERSGFSTYAEDIVRAFERAEKHYKSMLEQEDVINEAVYGILPYVVVRKVVYHMFICCENVK